MTAEDTVVGLDIGRYAVKAAWARRDQIVRLESLRLPQDTPDIRSILAPWLDTMALGGGACVLGVPGQQCMFQPFLVAPGDPRTLDQVAAMEVIRFNEMASEQMSYGYVRVAANPGERRLLLGMARPSTIHDMLTQAKGMGLDVVEVIPAPVALFAAGEPPADGQQPTLYLNVGYATTDLAIGSSGGLFFARSFAGGGQSFTEELARLRGLTVGQAENLKLTGGASVAELGAVAERWMSELRSCLSVYENLYSGRTMRPARVVLSGGAVQLPGLAEFVGAQLRTETRLVREFPGRPAAKSLPSYAVAVGLALGGRDAATRSLSLLPAPVRNELTLRRQKAYWVAAGLAAALIFGVCLAGGFWDAHRKKLHLAALYKTQERRNELGSQIETRRAEIARIHEIKLPVKKLLRGASLMQKLTSCIAESLSPNDQITMLCDAEIYFTPQAVAAPPERAGMRDRRRAPRPREKQAEGKGFERIIVEGYTRVSDFSTVRGLIAKLLQTDFIASADLLHDDQLVADSHPVSTQRDPAAQRFVIDIKLRSP